MRAKVFEQDTERLICEVELQFEPPVVPEGTPFVALLPPSDVDVVREIVGRVFFETETGERYGGRVTGGHTAQAETEVAFEGLLTPGDE